MKAKVALADLVDLIKKAKKAADTSSSLLTLGHVLLEAHSGRLIATCTDLSIAVITSIPAEVEEPGQALVPVKELAEFLSKAGKGMRKKEKGQTPVRLEGASHILSVEIEGVVRTELKGLDPSVEAVAISLVNEDVLSNRPIQAQAKKIGQLATVDGQALANAIKRVAPALRKTSTGSRRQQQARPLSFIWMQGTAPDKITLQATNGSQLFSIDVPAQVQRSFSVGVRLSKVAPILQGSDLTLFFRAEDASDSLHSITIQGEKITCVLTTANCQPPRHQGMISRMQEGPPSITFTCSTSFLATFIDLSKGDLIGFDTTDEETLTLLARNEEAGLLAQANLDMEEPSGRGRFVLQCRCVLDALGLLPDSDQVTLAYWQALPDNKGSAFASITACGAYTAIAALQDDAWWEVPPILRSEKIASVEVIPFLTQLQSACKIVKATAPQPWRSVLLKGRPGRLQITGAKQTDPDEDWLYKGDQEETQVETAITTSAFISGHFGQIVVPAKSLIAVLLRAKARKLTGVVIAAVENGLRMSLGGVTISLAGIPAEDFPLVPTLSIGEGPLLASFNTLPFAKAVVWTHRASSDKEGRAWCRGVWLEGDTCGINTIAADGTRLHVAHVEANCAPEFVAQTVVLRHLEKLVSALQGQVSMRVWGEGAFFHDGQTTIFCRRIDSNTPDYKALLSPNTTPDQTNQMLKIEAPPDELLKRVSMVQQKDAAWTGFIASPDALTIATQAVENATVNKGRIAVLPEGYLGRFALNGRYTTDALSYGNGPVTIQAQFDEQGEVLGAVLFSYQHPAALKKDLAEESLAGPMAQAVVMPCEVQNWAALEDEE